MEVWEGRERKTEEDGEEWVRMNIRRDGAVHNEKEDIGRWITFIDHLHESEESLINQAALNYRKVASYIFCS